MSIEVTENMKLEKALWFSARSLIVIAALAVATSCGSAKKSKSGGSSGSAPGADGPAGETGNQQDGESAVVKTDEFLAQVGGVPVTGQPVKTDRLELNFAVVDRKGQTVNPTDVQFACRVNDSEKVLPCTMTPFVVSGLQNGMSYKITVSATFSLDGVKVQTQDVTASFTVDFPPNTRPANYALGNILQVGDAYRMTVPAGMHITEYSSSKTTGVLSYYRIMVESDPYYLGNHACADSWDRGLVSLSPAGQPLMYCHSTPTRDAYKHRNEFRLAHNHVEIATDAALVTSENGERLSMAAFDADFELMDSRSRFLNACQNNRRAMIRVPMIPNFFLGTNPEKVNFWFCDTYQPDRDGRPQLWRVGAFYNSDEIDWNCPLGRDCGAGRSYPRAVEAVYMVRANAAVFTPELFARQAQERILETVAKLTP